MNNRDTSILSPDLFYIAPSFRSLVFDTDFLYHTIEVLTGVS